MKRWSKAFTEALDAIIPDESICHTASHRFGLGQPVWYKPEHSYGNNGAFICQRFYTGVFGDWVVEMTAENDAGGQLYSALEDHLTDEPPVLHPEHSGAIYVTGTGKTVKSIAGGSR